MALSGNKGEWSELYVLIKLLADGKLFAADKNLQKISSVFYPIIKILRDESTTERKLEYILNGKIRIKDSESDKILVQVETIEFVEKAKELFRLVSSQKGRSFNLPEMDDFLEKILIKKNKAKSGNKSDITLVLHDAATGMDPTVSFSIKSLMGKDSTLLNPGPGTNFIYKIIPKANTKIDYKRINKETIKDKKKGSKIARRLRMLESMNCKIEFHKIQSENFQLNMQLVDTDLPEIISFMLLYKYTGTENKTKDLLNILERNNPLNYRLDLGHPFYNYKVRSLLYDYALGMTPEAVWTGTYATNGGIIIVKQDGDVLCYHVYDKNVFQEYLIESTWFDQASTSEDEGNPGNERVFPKGKKPGKKYFFGWIYEEDDQCFIKINLQIRFLKTAKQKSLKKSSSK